MWQESEGREAGGTGRRPSSGRAAPGAGCRGLLFLPLVLWPITPQCLILSICMGSVQPALRDQLDRWTSLLPPEHEAWQTAVRSSFLHGFYNVSYVYR